MTRVTVKSKFQVTIPQALREELAISEGDLLEAEVENGRLVFIPKVVVDRDAVFIQARTAAAETRSRWEAEGTSEAALTELIETEAEAVRTELYEPGQTERNR